MWFLFGSVAARPWLTNSFLEGRQKAASSSTAHPMVDQRNYPVGTKGTCKGHATTGALESTGHGSKDVFPF